MLAFLLLASAASAAPSPDFDAVYKKARAAFCGHDLKTSVAALPEVRSAALALPPGDRRRAKALSLEASVARATGDLAGAAAAADQAEAFYRAEGPAGRKSLAGLLVQRSTLRRQAHDLAEARHAGKEALSLFRALGVRDGEAAALSALGVAAAEGDDDAASLGYHRKAYRIFDGLGRAEAAASEKANAATELAALGRAAEAERLFLDAIAQQKAKRGTRDASLSFIASRYAAFLSKQGPERARDAARWRELAASAAPPDTDVSVAGGYGCASE